MPGSVTVPSTLSGHAADIWRGAFLSGYDGTCAKRSDRDGCAASIAWAAVKNKYRKGAGGDWVTKAEDAASSQPAAMSSEEYPQPLGGSSPAWKKAFDAALIGECAKAEDPAACASVVADAAVRAEGKVERTLVKLHRNDYGDLSLPLVIRKDYSPEKRADFAQKGWALPDGSYPIADGGDLADAIQSFGRAPESKSAQVKAHISKRARQLGALDQVSGEWGGEKKSMTASEVRRAQEDDEDQVMLEQGLGEQIAVRPDNISSNEWMARPLEQRTVRWLIIERSIARSYEAAAEKAIDAGWQAISNPTRRDEFIFQRWVDSPDGPMLQRSVLVRRTGTIDWRMRELSRGATMSLAVQIPPHERRYGDHRL